MHSAELIATDTRQALVGIGLTGQSVVRHMRRAGRSLTVFDSRVQPPGLAAFRRAFPDLEVRLGEPDPAELARFSDLILSPGIDP
ncbi:MAG: UDP-N-acetylmuramoyl-L-alanine--D-glutamate ligase, partial [Cellvibrionales bacterium]|nr:UDP-N-acetylmuramoyl-L-alanine--D-glutamate ligase [Cellvibrionales bacterium]